MSNTDPYENSVLVERIKKSSSKIRIGFFDIDSTLTGNDQAVNALRTKLDELGFGIVFVTARTEEMPMSEYQFNKSVEMGLERPAPNLGTDPLTGKHFYAPAETIEPPGILDPDIIAGSTGTRILVGQIGGGFMPDLEYENALCNSDRNWRETTLKLIENLNLPKDTYQLSPADSPGNYENLITDVYYPKYRIQLIFESLEKKTLFKEKFIESLHDSKAIEKLSVHVGKYLVTDDSNPLKNMYSVYIVPERGSKADAVNSILKNISEHANIDQSQMDVVIAGDAYPDILMCIYGAREGAKVTGIMVGGSRMSVSLVDPSISHFAGEDLSHLKQRLTGQKGEFIYTRRNGEHRKLIIGDSKYPGLIGPETILRYISDSFE
jgi:hydroxymethylpyrimidine pyrophosphatase-like HAD family hydrolase